MKRFKEFSKKSVEPVIIRAVPVHGKHARSQRSTIKEEATNKSSSWLDVNDNKHLGTTEKVHEKLSLPEEKMDQLPHRDVLHSYTTDSIGVNMHLIKRSLDPKYTPPKSSKLDKYAEQLGEHIKSHQPLKHSLHVYHGTDQWHPGEEASKHPEGHVKIPSFLSTTINKPSALYYASEDHSGESRNVGRHILHIHLKRGQRGAYVGDHGAYGNEHEYLLPAGQTYKIHPKPTEGPDGVKIWHAKVVG